MEKNIFWVLLLFSLSTPLSAQIFINEICPANADINYDADFYNFSGWVELYNAGSSSVNVGGYYLSDISSNKTKWRIPNNTSISSKGYLLIWCDEMSVGLHTNFDLDAEGEEIMLFNSAGLVLDKLEFPIQYTNISYGRISDGASTWAYLLTPTPKSTNSSRSATNRTTAPRSSLPAGKYSGTQSIVLSHSNPNAEIRFTIDGSEPNKASTIYQSPISISTNAILKAKAFIEGFIPSITISNTYFINQRNFTLPVVSLSTQPSYLWDNTIGIYTDGTNGVAGNCTENRVNWNRDWDRHAVLEYFGEGGQKIFDQAIDIRIGGACSRNMPQKSFIFKARDKYGDNVIPQKLFETKGSNRYGGITIRNSGNDFNMTMFRDALLQSLVIGQMDVDYLAYQPSVLYLNGEYWGIQNLREKIDADYFESNYGIKKDDLDLLEFEGNAIEGTSDAYWNYLNTLQNLDRSQESTFAFIDQRIDVQEYINYLSTQIYYANTDWPGNNQKYWRQRSGNGKFRWILWDLDFGFGIYQDVSYPTHPTLHFATDPNSGVGWPNPSWSTLPIRLVLENPTFRARFIQTLVANMNTTFKPERVIDFVDSFQNRIQTEMPYHKQRWGGDMGAWNYEVQRLRDFAIQRYGFMQDYTANFFNLGDKVSLNISAGENNTFKINQVMADRPIENGVYYKGLSIQVEAIPTPGYAFSHWQITKQESAQVPMINQGDVWKYFDLGANLGTAWKEINFDDSAWPQGNAQLGYGEGDESTVIGFGPDANNKFITSYFRKTFTIADANDLDVINCQALFDDGIVVYINGTEVYRNNMPNGTIIYNTLATTAIPAENAFVTVNIPDGLLFSGQNVVAVEVHQNSQQSSDLGFDFSLNASVLGEEQTFNTQELTLTDTLHSNLTMHAFFTQAPSFNGLVINEFSANNTLVLDNFDEAEDWVELYNASNEEMNLSGLYITDNLIHPTKYQLPMSDENIIAAGAYKILWADEDLGQGFLHLPFKLSDEGEQIGVYQQLGNTLFKVDEVTFGKQERSVSMARYPNATGPFVITGRFTPNEDNIIEEPLGISVSNHNDVYLYPNPTSNRVSIKSLKPIDQLSIYDSQGRLVKQVSQLGTQADFNIENLNKGLYLFLIKSGDQTETRRMIKQ